MNSRGDSNFWRLYRKLPQEVRAQARVAYKFFADNPNHPSLHFKCVNPQENIYSVRVGIQYRALGKVKNDAVVWFWIGTHGEYDKLLG